MLARLIVVIISQYIQILITLETNILYVNYISSFFNYRKDIQNINNKHICLKKQTKKKNRSFSTQLSSLSVPGYRSIDPVSIIMLTFKYSGHVVKGKKP